MNTNTTSAQSPADFWPKADFCYRCAGNCMAGSGMRDGDIVFIRAQGAVNNGEIAAVQVDDCAYLKRFYVEDNQITLVSDDPSFKPWVFVGDQRSRVMVIGKAVGYLSYLEQVPNDAQVSDRVQDHNDAYSPTEEEALQIFRSMTPEQRTQILDWMNTRISRREL